MRCQLQERDALIADQETEIDSMRAQFSKLNHEKSRTDAEISALQMSVHQTVCAGIRHSVVSKQVSE